MRSGNKHAELLYLRILKPVRDNRVATTNGYCHFNTPAAILPHQLRRKDISEVSKFELRKRAKPPRGFQPIHPITNSLWICAQRKRLNTKH